MSIQALRNGSNNLKNEADTDVGPQDSGGGATVTPPRYLHRMERDNAPVSVDGDMPKPLAVLDTFMMAGSQCGNHGEKVRTTTRPACCCQPGSTPGREHFGINHAAIATQARACVNVIEGRMPWEDKDE